MKKQLVSLLSLAVVLLALASCSAETAFDAVEVIETAETQAVASMHANMGATRQAEGAANMYKQSWADGEGIAVYNGGSKYLYFADNQNETTTFTSLGGEKVSVEGQTVAIYPANTTFNGQTGTFSFENQKGREAELSRFFLMTATANVQGAEMSLDFTEHASVLVINIAESMAEGARISDITVSGEGISSKVQLLAQNGMISLQGNENHDLVLTNPSMDADGNVYVALYNAANADFDVVVNDSMGGHFFVTVDGASVSNGTINALEAADFDGGYAIDFSASTAGWGC